MKHLLDISAPRHQEYFFDSIGILEAKPLFSHVLPEPPEPDIDATGLDLPPSRHPSGPLRSPSRDSRDTFVP